MLDTFSECCDITNDNNLIQFEAGTLALWGLKSHAKIAEIETSQVSYVHCSYDGATYIVGFENGDVKVYDNAKLKDLEEDLPSIGSKVTSIVSSPDYIAYSSDKGKVILYEEEFDYDSELDEDYVTLNEGDGNSINCLKLSVEKNYLYGLLDKSPDDKNSEEKICVWNLITKKMVHKHDLDIEDNPEDKEDVNKLMIHHTEDASMMFIRGCYKKGVQILSFDDGVKIDEMEKMHNNSILQIILKYDKNLREQTLITCSKDKKVKVWDWMNKHCIATLSQHNDEVTSIVLTKDANQTILFSGSLDKRIIAWHTKLYNALFEVTLDHSIYTLRLTPDNEILVAIDHATNGQMSTLQLEENLESIRLNLPREVYENVDLNITNNNKYIIFPVQDDYIIEVWNVESKVLAFKIDPVNSEQITIITSPDSKYLFYTSDLNEITQMDIEQHKIVAKYTGTHTSEISALSVTPDQKRF